MKKIFALCIQIACHTHRFVSHSLCIPYHHHFRPSLAAFHLSHPIPCGRLKNFCCKTPQSPALVLEVWSYVVSLDEDNEGVDKKIVGCFRCGNSFPVPLIPAASVKHLAKPQIVDTSHPTSASISPLRVLGGGSARPSNPFRRQIYHISRSVPADVNRTPRGETQDCGY